MIRARPFGHPPPALGGLPQFWMPYRYQQFGGRQWNSDFAGPPATLEVSPAAAVNEIVEAFRGRGEAQGLALASMRGPSYVAGAKLYIASAGSTEEELAKRSAEITSKVVRAGSLSTSPGAISRLFIEARLQEVRRSRSNGHTPPQAVLDRPVVATHGLPRWVTYGALTLSGIGLFLSVVNMSRTRGGR